MATDADGYGSGRVSDYQFVKALEDHGRVLLVRSMKPAAVVKRKEAAKDLIDYFAENFDVVYTESQIFKKMNNLKQRLKERVNTHKVNEAYSLLMRLLQEENQSLDCGKNETDQISDLQFLKTLSECGQALLIHSKQPAAQRVKRDSAQAMRDAFAEDFGILYSESKILMKFNSMRSRLRHKMNAKSPLTEAEAMLKKLLNKENAKSVYDSLNCFNIIKCFLILRSYFSSEGQPMSVSSESDTETSNLSPQLHRNSSPISSPNGLISVKEEIDGLGPTFEPLVPLSTLNYDFNSYSATNGCSSNVERNDSNSNAELQQKVLTEQLNVFRKQMEVLDVQKKVYLLKKELLMAKLEALKSNKDNNG